MSDQMTADELRAAVWSELRNDEYDPPPETDAALVQCVADVNARLGAALVREQFAPCFKTMLDERTAELAALRARHDRLVAVVRVALREVGTLLAAEES